MVDLEIVSTNSLFVCFLAQVSLVLFLIPTTIKAYKFSKIQTDEAKHYFDKVGEALEVAYKLAFLLLICTYLYNRGFLAGNAVSADIIISTVPMWVYLLSVIPCLVPENLKLIGRPKKIIMSLMTFFGVSLIAISDA